MNLFEESLQSFLQQTLEETSSFEGVSLSEPKQLRQLLAKEKSSIDSLVASYKSFIEEREAVGLEHLLKKQLKRAGFTQANLPLYCLPHIYQKLPRYCNSDERVIDEIKKPFTNLLSLKRHLIDKSVLSLYENVILKEPRSIVLFTYVMEDGLGDFVAQKQAFELLREDFPHISRVVLMPLQYKSSLSEISQDLMVHYYSSKEELHFDFFSLDLKKALQKADYLLQIPTFYPYFDELIASYEIKDHQTVGEYGFIDSTWAHPLKEHTCCMGLHFLERGIFIPDMPKASQLKISKKVEQQLYPGSDLRQYKKETDFVFSYLKTIEGAVVFLHLALTYFSLSTKNLDFSFVDAHLALQLIKEGYFQVEGYGIKELRIQVKEERYVIPIASAGKVVRILELGPLSPEDAKALTILSHTLTASRGDQSFSEAVSASAFFFYDAAPHAGPFLEDLLALARARLKAFPSAIAFIEGFRTPFHAKGQFHLLVEIGQAMGRLLQDPATRKGLKKLYHILRLEYSFNKTLVQIFKRKQLLDQYPSLAEKEKDILQLLLKGLKSVPETFEYLQKEISNYLFNPR